MKKVLCLFILFAVLKSTANAQKPKIEFIGQTPEDLHGCGCTFSQNKSDYENSNHIFAGSINEAILKIDGQVLRFNFKKGPFEAKNNETVIAENNDYKISIKTKDLKSGYESVVKQGTMIVTYKKTGTISKLPLYGICGC